MEAEVPPASFERLRTYLTARAALTPAEIDFIRGLFSPRRLEKGDEAVVWHRER